MYLDMSSHVWGLQYPLPSSNKSLPLHNKYISLVKNVSNSIHLTESTGLRKALSFVWMNS